MVNVSRIQIMILLQNKQLIPIPGDLEQNTQILLKDLGYVDFDISIVCVDEQEMQHYNKQFRDKDKPTDILSFPFHSTLKAGDRIDAQTDDEKNLGDIILCPQFIENDLERWEQTYQERMKTLLVHGVCHLLGYDHIEDSDYEVMKREEERLRALLD